MSTKIVISHCEQRSDEWFSLRLGLLTGSDFADLLVKGKSGESAARRKLRTAKLSERLTGQSDEDFYVNKHIQRGIDLEPAARRSFEAETGLWVNKVGFVRNDEIGAGCSPDGLIGDDAGLELKCPKTSTHLTYLEDGVCPAEYVGQVQGAMLLTGRSHWWFASFDDRIEDKELQLFVVRVERDEAYIAKLKEEIVSFNRDVAGQVQRLRKILAERRAANQKEAA